MRLPCVGPCFMFPINILEAAEDPTVISGSDRNVYVGLNPSVVVFAIHVPSHCGVKICCNTSTCLKAHLFVLTLQRRACLLNVLHALFKHTVLIQQAGLNSLQ